MIGTSAILLPSCRHAAVVAIDIVVISTVDASGADVHDLAKRSCSRIVHVNPWKKGHMIAASNH